MNKLFFVKENTSFSYFLQIVVPLEYILNIASLFLKKTRLGRQNKTCLITKMHLNYHEAKNPTLEFYKSGISTLDSTFSKCSLLVLKPFSFVFLNI